MAELDGHNGGRFIFVIGPPCSGKGTQSNRLASKFGFVHLSTGDMVREAVINGTELGLQMKDYVDRADFVPDDMLIGFIENRLKQPDVAEKGCVLDGYPRTAKQATALLGAVTVDRLLQFEVPDEVVLKRAPERRIDPETGDIYNLRFVPPPPDVEARLTCRDRDGDEAAFKERLQAYRAQLRQIEKTFKGKIVKVDGHKEPDDVFAAVIKQLNAPLGDGDDWSDEEPVLGLPCGAKIVVEVAPSMDVSEEGGEAVVGVSIKVPDDQTRVPVDICCVIDVSGSMGDKATPANPEDGQEHHDTGLTILDIVRHAVKTVICVLNDDDRLAIVAFTTEASTAFALSQMTAEGKKSAIEALDALTPLNSTNLWAGVHTGMEALRDGATSRRKTILLLTDGQPNVAPAAGHIPELKLYKECHSDFNFQMNTFGFGYNLDSKLLEDLAAEGNGTFAFIPDAVIVGTTFVNCIANTLSTWVQNAQVHLMLQNGTEFRGPVLGEYPVTEATWGRIVSLGPLQLGHCRDVAVALSIPAGVEPYLEVVLTYGFPGGAQGKASVQAASRKATDDALMAELRSEVVQVAFTAIRDAEANDCSTPEENVKVLQQKLEKASTTCGDGRLAALRGDVDGRMAKALQGRDRFNRWGKHYLRALARAHQLQLCTNYMDAGLQVYGGSLFAAMKADGDAAFLSLPPPKPSREVATAAATTAAAAPAPNMQTYYAGAGGGCFGAASMVVVVAEDGQELWTAVANVRAGESVRVADGGTARVLCAVHIARVPAKKLVALSGGLTITPRHPVRWCGEWQRPIAFGSATESHDGYVYNFVLDRCHVLLVNGFECATWGHGLEGAVVGHPFYGTDRVVADLMAMPGWEDGIVRVEGCVRDRASGQVVGLRGRDSTKLWSPMAEAAFGTNVFQHDTPPVITAF